MLQAAGDLGLEQESRAADRVVGVLVEDLLRRHLSVQLAVKGDEAGAQSTSGVRPQEAEPLAFGGRRADGVARRAVGVAVGLGPGSDVDEGGLDVGPAGRGQALAGRAAQIQCREAPFGIAPVDGEVLGEQGLEQGRGAGRSIPRARLAWIPMQGKTGGPVTPITNKQ
jgi:hypothetical protein